MRIAVLQIYDKRLVSTVEGKNCFALIEGVNQYCKKHKYDHFVHYISDSYKVNPEFSKYSKNPFSDKPIKDLYNMQHTKFFLLGTIREHFLKNDYDYICMLDIDIAIHDYNFKIEDFIQVVNGSEKSLIMGMECVKYESYFDGRFPNGGVYLFKNTEWSKRFILGLIKAITIIGHGTLRLEDCCQEQMQISFATMVCPDCDREVLITNGHTNIQHLFMPWYYPNLTAAPDRKHLFIHFTGSHKKSIPIYLNHIKSMDININIDSYNNVHDNISIKHL